METGGELVHSPLSRALGAEAAGYCLDMFPSFRSLLKLLLTDRSGFGAAVSASAHVARLALRNRVTSRPVVSGEGVDVSLTTYGTRSRTVYLAIESIGRGDVRPRRLILWVDAELVRNLPGSLKRLQARGLEVLESENFGPHTKQFPYVTREAVDGVAFATADDDVLYPRTWLAQLASTAAEAPELIHGHRAHRITHSAGTIAPYAEWGAASDTEPSFATFCTGVSGVIYPPAMARHLREAGEGFVDVAPRADDVWVHAIAVRNGIRSAQLTAEPADFPTVPRTQAVALFQENGSGGGNDAQIAATYGATERARIFADAAAGLKT